MFRAKRSALNWMKTEEEKKNISKTQENFVKSIKELLQIVKDIDDNYGTVSLLAGTEVEEFLENFADRRNAFNSILLNKLEGFFADLEWELNLNPYATSFKTIKI